jgi:hypothetical protein
MPLEPGTKESYLGSVSSAGVHLCVRELTGSIDRAARSWKTSYTVNITLGLDNSGGINRRPRDLPIPLHRVLHSVPGQEEKKRCAAEVCDLNGGTNVRSHHNCMSNL